MEIRTKFNIGDKVWVIDSRKVEDICPICEGKGYVIIKNENFRCPKCNAYRKINERNEYFIEGQIKITDIRVWCLYEPEIRYFDDKYSKEGIMVFEKNCFATEAEAQAECDKRNKGE